MLGLNSTFCIPDDCQTKLIDLNISGTKHRTKNKTITCSSPTPSLISVNRDRSQLLTPARLNFNSHPSLQAPVTQTSWVAGGFFVKNSMSPQKRQEPLTDLHPILSRTSSQSSGFESRASSAHNGNTNGSRESSIGGDVVSNFSEPLHFADSVSQMGVGCVGNSASTLPRPKPFFPALNRSQSTFIDSSICRNESLTNYSMFPWTNNDTMLPNLPVYHQFGTQRGIDSRFDNGSSNSMNNLNKFTYHSSSIHKGSFIKPLSDNMALNDK